MSAIEIIAGTLGAGALAAAGAGIYHAILQGWRHLEQIRTEVARERNERALLKQSLQTGQLAIARQEWELTQGQVDRARLIYPDGTGQFPLIMIDSKTVYDPTLAALANVTGGLKDVDPRLAIPEQRRRLYAAMAGLGAPGQKAVLEAEADDAQPWPGTVNLGRQTSIHNLVIGATQAGDAVTLSLHDLMHCLLAGASGWGKSIWLRSFVYQLARAPEPVEAIAIDVSGSEFNAMTNWERLRYPVAKTPGDAVTLLGKVVQELERRQQLFASFPLATNLQEYNSDTSEPLTPWVILADEGTALLGDNKDVAGAMKNVLWRARQFGIYAIVAGQSARYDVIPTPLRDQFSTRLAFRLSPTSSRVVLDDRSAADLKDKGRCVAVLHGQEPQELQGPFVSRQQFIDALAGSGPRCAMPEAEPGQAEQQAETIREMHEQGMSQSQIEQQIFGYTGGKAYTTVKNALSDNGAN